MRTAVLLSFLCGFAFADGGSISCPSDYTEDTLTTTVWKAKVTQVRRKGIVVTSGTYSLPYSWGETLPISDFGQIGLSTYTLSMSITKPWYGLYLNGGGFSAFPLYSH